MARARSSALLVYTILVFVFLMMALLEVEQFRRQLASLDRQELIHAGAVLAAKFRRYMLVRTVLSLLTGVAIYLFALIAGLEPTPAWGILGFALNYFFDVSVGFFVLVAIIGIAAAIYFLPFGGLERVFGYLGLALLVYVAASIKLDPDWGDIGTGFVPHVHSQTLYWYFVVGMIAAAMMPYEIYFYSSGAVEEGWDEKDLKVNPSNAFIGFGHLQRHDNLHGKRRPCFPVMDSSMKRRP